MKALKFFLAFCLISSYILLPLFHDKAIHDCESIVVPQDYPPIRSPQAVHSFIAEKVHNKSVIELGTRNGDGISCFAHFASTAIALEYDRTYCARLEERARLQYTPPIWSVECADAFKYKNLDADVITWWQQYPLTNFAVLKRLKEEQCAGRVRPSAQAILLFDEKWPKDMKDFELLRSMFSWQKSISFDEHEMCASDTKNEIKEDFCYRSKGVFIVASLPLAQYFHVSC